MVPPSFIRRLAGRKGDAAKFINKDAPTTGASLSVGETGGTLMRRHRAACSEEPEAFSERGLSEERLRKVNMHDVGEKDLEKHDKRRRKHKIGEQRLTGFFGGQHDEHSKYADGHADVE